MPGRSFPDFGCPGPSHPLARFLAFPIVPLSHNEGTSVPLSRKVALSRPVGNPSRNSSLSSGTGNKVDQHQNFQFGHLGFFKNLENQVDHTPNNLTIVSFIYSQLVAAVPKAV